jgi:hypothetical protein
MIFDCRDTKQGAFTAVIWTDKDIDFTSFDVSKTGRHWKERVEGSIGAEFVLQDITNSGKHQCTRYRFTEDGVEIVETEGDICPCDLPIKYHCREQSADEDEKLIQEERRINEAEMWPGGRPQGTWI